MKTTLQQNIIKGFLGAVLVCAGVIFGLRLMPVDAELAQEVALDTPRDVSGEWIGMTTEDYGMHARYDYRIVIEQDGDEITGMLYLTMTNHPIETYTRTVVEGTVTGDTVFYASQEILDIENGSLDYLCLVQTTLTFEEVDGQEMLVGTWEPRPDERADCDTISGRTTLTRQTDTNDAGE
ncbi:MAG: hypothetical protein AAFN11_08225 [Chloroflexota bacterium]